MKTNETKEARAERLAFAKSLHATFNPPALPCGKPMTRTIIINVTTEDGELLARERVEIPLDKQYISVEPVGYSMPGRNNEEVINIGRLQ